MTSEKPMEISDEDVLKALSHITATQAFRKAYRLRQLLEHLINKQLADESHDLKGYNIGLDVFEKSSDFNPDTDTIVRVQMGRLRRMLELYYLTAGKEAPLIIDIPKGRYIPTFSLRTIIEDNEVVGETKSLRERTSLFKERVGERFEEFIRDDPPYLLFMMGLSFFMGYLLFAPGKEVSLGIAPQEIVAMPTGPSISVFPFNNETGNPKNRLLIRGIPGHIVHGLTQFKDLNVFVLDTTRAKGKSRQDLIAVARKRNTTYALVGGFAVEGTNLSVSTFLIRVKTSQVIWSKDYHVELTGHNMHVIQNNIAASVAGQLGQPYGIINRLETAMSRKRDKSAYSSYECVLLFFDSSPNYTSAVHLDVRNCLERSTKQDPGYARAWAALAWTYVDEFRHGFNVKTNDPRPPLDRALAAALKAVVIDPNDSFNHRYMSIVHVARGEYHDAEKSIMLAVKLNPNNANVVADVGWNQKALGKWKAAIKNANKAILLNPGHRSWYLETPILYYYHTKDCENGYKTAKSYHRHSQKTAIADIFVIISALGCKKHDFAKHVNALNTKYSKFLTGPRKLLRNYGIPKKTIDRIIIDLQKAGVAVDG